MVKKSIFSLCIVVCMLVSMICVPTVQATTLYERGVVTFDDIDKVSAETTGFTTGSIIDDPTYTIPGYESRQGNKVYDPTPSSANEIVFGENTGVLMIKAQMMFDYYNGLEDPLAGYVAKYYDNSDEYIGKMVYTESGKKYYNESDAELTEADFDKYIAEYGNFLFRKTFTQGSNNISYWNNAAKNSGTQYTEAEAAELKANKGYYIDDEFTTDIGKYYGSFPTGSATFNVRNSTSGVNIFSLARSGNVTTRHGGWGNTSFKKNKWYDIQLALDVETATLTGKYRLAGEENYSDIQWQCAIEDTDGVLENLQTTKYKFDGNAVGNNNNGTLPDNISRLRLQGANNVAKDYIDNFEIHTYKRVYESINDCTTAAEVKEKLDLFSDLGLFNKGTASSLAYTGGLYENLVGKNFKSTSELQAFYDESIKDYQGIKYYDFENGTNPFANGDASYYIKNENGTYSWVSSSTANATQMTGTKGAIVADPTNPSNHVFSAGRSTTELRSDNGVNTSIGQNYDTNVLEFDVLVPEYDTTKDLANIRFNTNYSCNDPWERTWTDIIRFSKGNVIIGTSREYEYISGVEANTWHKVRMEIDSADDIIKYYFDGKLKKTVKCLESKDANVRSVANEKSTKLGVMQIYNIGADNEYLYLDNLTFYRYDNLCTKINNCASASDVYNVLKKYSSLGFFDFGDIIDSVIDKDAVYSSLIAKGFTSNVAVQEAFDNAAWDKSAEEAGGGGLILSSRNEESDGENNYIKDVSLVINENNITDTAAKFIAASYQDGALYDVQTLDYTGSLAKRQKIEWQNMNLNITKADSYKIFMLSATDGIKPLTKALVKDVELSVLANFYPGWAKKAVTFTLDDANQTADKKFIDILKAAGMKATFNLKTDGLNSDPEKVRELYAGFEVANHTKYHPYPYYMYENQTLTPTTNTYDENGNLINLYRRENGGYVAQDEAYIKCIQAGHAEIEKIFGEGSDTGFIWPGPAYGNRTALKEYATEHYDMLRIAVTLDDPSFNLPSDWLSWSFNANYDCSYSRSVAFDNLSLDDTDTLRWLCFGVHPSEYFSTAESEANLQKSVDLLKNRPDTYWYAGNREILDYTEALKKLSITRTSVTNNSDLTLYIKVNGVKTTIAPGEKIGK